MIRRAFQSRNNLGNRLEGMNDDEAAVKRRIYDSRDRRESQPAYRVATSFVAVPLTRKKGESIRYMATSDGQRMGLNQRKAMCGLSSVSVVDEVIACSTTMTPS